ncbi:MAG TPA: LysR substrate-binding domain-containing protein, partial [Methylibium sp.]
VPALDRLDASVRQIRQARGRHVVNVTTFASFASLWLLPRLEAFQREHPDIDIRVAANDRLTALDDTEMDLILRYTSPLEVPDDAVHLFGETITPAISPWLAARIAAGEAPPLKRPADLIQHTLLEEDDHRPSAEYLGWRHWLAQQGEAQLEPRSWIYLNFTYQQVQAALSGQGVALARIGLVAEQLQRGELVEPFGHDGRIHSPYAYWLILLAHSRERPEVLEFAAWVQAQAALTRAEMGEMVGTEAGSVASKGRAGKKKTGRHAGGVTP